MVRLKTYINLLEYSVFKNVTSNISSYKTYPLSRFSCLKTGRASKASLKKKNVKLSTTKNTNISGHKYVQSQEAQSKKQMESHTLYVLKLSHTLYVPKPSY